jgi:alcohol-forming fatty acyl-CoA reductase
MYICRTIDSFIIGYAKQALSIFLVDLDLIMDVVSVCEFPSEMVVIQQRSIKKFS